MATGGIALRGRLLDKSASPPATYTARPQAPERCARDPAQDDQIRHQIRGNPAEPFRIAKALGGRGCQRGKNLAKTHAGLGHQGILVTFVGWTHASDPIKGGLIALSGTIFTAAVTVLGSYAAYTYSKEKEDQARRLEIRLKYRAQQIAELYGPLVSLIEQIFNVWTVRENILKHTAYTEADNARVREFVWRRYFRPLHGEIATLLRTKLYLLEDSGLPDIRRGGTYINSKIPAAPWPPPMHMVTMP